MYKPVRIGAILCNDQFQLGKSSHRDPVTKDQVQKKRKNKTASWLQVRPASGELKQVTLVLQRHGVDCLPKPVLSVQHFGKKANVFA